MNNDTDWNGAWEFLFFILIFGSGMILYDTIQMCVEKPQECKIKYDYYKLVENQK